MERVVHEVINDQFGIVEGGGRSDGDAGAAAARGQPGQGREGPSPPASAERQAQEHDVPRASFVGVYPYN